MTTRSACRRRKQANEAKPLFVWSSTLVGCGA
jgi:hypothetical protein